MRESFLREILCSLAQQKRAIRESFIRESFLRENLFFHEFAKVFSLESFPLYGMLCIILGNGILENTRHSGCCMVLRESMTELCPQNVILGSWKLTKRTIMPMTNSEAA